MAAQWPLPEDHKPGDPNFTGGINQLSANLNAMHDDADGAANQAIAAAATATAAAQTAHDISGIATTDDAVSTLLTNPTAGPKTLAGLDARYEAVTLPRANGTDDTSAINAVLAGGGTSLKGQVGDTYKLSGALVLHSGQTLDMAGCTIQMKTGSSSSHVNNAAITPVSTAADATVSSGSNVVTTSLATSAVVGQSLVVAGAGVNGYGPLVGIITAVGSGTITLGKLGKTADAANATATVSGAAVALYNRDKNITVKGGNWTRAANVGGSGSNLHMLTFRHIDGLTVDIDGATSTDGKYTCSIADASNVNASARNLNTYSDGIHLQGPISSAQIPVVAGTTGDDLFAITPCDWAAYADSAGDVDGVEIGSLQASSVGTNALAIYPSQGTAIGAVQVSGGIYGDAGANGTSPGIFLGESTADPRTVGGTVGLIDLGVVDLRNQSASGQIMNVYSLAINTLRGRIRYANSRTLGQLVRIGKAASDTTIGLMELDFDYAGAGISSALVYANGNTITRMRLTGKFAPSGTNKRALYINGATITDLTMDMDATFGGAGGADILVHYQSGGLGFVRLAGRTTGGNNAIKIDTSATLTGGLTVTPSGRFDGVGRVMDCRGVGTVTVICQDPTVVNETALPFFVNGSSLVFGGTYRIQPSTAWTYVIDRAASESLTALPGCRVPARLDWLQRVVGSECIDSGLSGGTGTAGIPVVCTTTAAGGWKNAAGGSY